MLTFSINLSEIPFREQDARDIQETLGEDKREREREVSHIGYDT